MAEGGDFPSLKDGSDADFELTCTPCGEDNIREEAAKYCPECQEYLCTSCTRHHGRQKATRTHKLLAKDNAKEGFFVAKTKCCYHPDRDIEMYCETHDMVYCTMCIATEHRLCDGVNKIAVRSKPCVNETEIHSILDETKKAQESLAVVAARQQKNVTLLEEQINDIQERLKEVEARLIEHMRKLKRDTTQSLEKKYAKMKGELESELCFTTNMIQNLEKTSEKLQSIALIDADQQFIQMKLTKKTVTDAKKLHSNSESNVTKSVYFTENTDLVTSVMVADALGQVRAEGENRKPLKLTQYKMKSKKKINVQLVVDKTTCLISDVCQLQDGKIMLTDNSNRKVKRLDVNYNIKDLCDLDAAPTGICCIDKNEVAVKMSNQKIQFISVGSSLSKTRCIDIVSGGQFGLSFCVGELWISNCYGVDVNNLSGKRLKCINKYPNGMPIFKSNFTQQITVSDDVVVVTDQGDTIVCLNKDGTVRREIQDTRLKRTRGACVSDDGTIFLCGYNSNNILMFSSEGKCLGELVTAANWLKCPISLCYDSNKHNIVVTCDNSNTITIIELGE